LEAAGYYQAAFAITGSLPGFIFAAMGSDFLPRVSAAKDEAEARMITENQIVAGLLMGTPLVVILLTLGDHCVGLLYTDGFREAVPLLSWMAWGIFIRLMAWPWAFWMLGRGSSGAIVFVEGAAALFMTILTLVMLDSSGLIGAAKGFALGQAAYALMLLVFMRKRSGSLAWNGSSAVRAWLRRCWLGFTVVCPFHGRLAVAPDRYHGFRRIAYLS
jgi:PST family polysaccharide transporter